MDKWTNSQMYTSRDYLRLMVINTAIFTLLIIATTLTIYTVHRTSLITQVKNYAEQLCLGVISEFSGLITQAQNQTCVMADLASIMEPDVQQYKKSFSQIIVSADMQGIVAGGGVWPEPYTFTPNIQRRSFFWGKQPNGTLKFYDDYNDPNGPGYHNESWYIPAQYYPPSTAIWSQSYTDPYSKQPMVTCTVPYYKDNLFKGVCTVDLKLEGLNQTLQAAMQSTGG
ncbi:MAG: PDC sensor domain-containing protein, partial [Phycisphaeraceae bacterium]|nr:PDC sensor domain-containing protein [Phycisphaeraceae bacterium]